MPRLAKWTLVHQNGFMGRPNKDAEHLGCLRDYFAQQRALPSYAELSKVLGFRAKNAAFKLAGRLMSAGYLGSGPGGRLVPGPRFFELPCIDARVPAGRGEPAEFSGGVELKEIDRLLVDVPSRTFLVPIRGDSMCEAGVLDGDTAVVEQTPMANSGDFVIALVDGQYTMKELQYERNQPVLVPHNRCYEPIRPESELNIIGIVRGIIRRYHSSGRRVDTRAQGEKT